MSESTHIIWIACSLVAAISIVLGFYAPAFFVMITPVMCVLGDIADAIKNR